MILRVVNFSSRLWFFMFWIFSLNYVRIESVKIGNEDTEKLVFIKKCKHQEEKYAHRVSRSTILDNPNNFNICNCYISKFLWDDLFLANIYVHFSVNAI